MLDGSALLGFQHLVSPIKKVGGPQNPSMGCLPLPRHVSELLGRVNEASKMAPSFLHVARQMLQREQISPQSQKAYLDRLSSISRYDRAFRKLYALCCLNGINLEQANVMEVADQIVQLNQLSPAEARNAYSACLWLPRLAGLRFNVVIKKM